MPYIEDEDPKPLRSGVRTFKDSDDSVSYRWALFDRAAVNLALGYVAKDPQDLALTLTGWYYFNQGAGRRFASTPGVKVTRTKILIVQRIGWDI